MIYGFRAPMILRPAIVAMMILTTAYAMAQDETADSVPSVESYPCVGQHHAPHFIKLSTGPVVLDFVIK